MAQFARPVGGGHVWVTLRQPLDDARLYREALAGGVTFVPGAAMLVERPRATHLRLSYGLPDPASIGEGVRRLAQAIRLVGRDAPAQRRSLPVT
jgi:DNA-binding transcriptional MocR family regulator